MSDGGFAGNTLNMPAPHRPGETGRAERAMRAFFLAALVFFVGTVGWAMLRPEPRDGALAAEVEPSVRIGLPTTKVPSPTGRARAGDKPKARATARPVRTARFSGCTALRKVYPGGVPIGHRAYEPRLDVDSDLWACELRDGPVIKPSTSRPTSAGPERERFTNCTELRKVYPEGVPIGHPAYERRHDRDGDNWACEVSGPAPGVTGSPSRVPGSSSPVPPSASPSARTSPSVLPTDR